MYPFVCLKPCHDLRVLMRRVVIDDYFKVQIPGCLAFELLEEAQKFVVAMTLHALTEDLAGGNVERGEERGRAVALVVVRHRVCSP